MEPLYSLNPAMKSHGWFQPYLPLAGGHMKMKTDYDEAFEKDLNSDPAKRTVWHVYNEKSTKEDEAFLKGINEAMDVLLIFAGLFSATAAAFLQFTLPLLSDNPQNETNQLLSAIFHKLENSSYPMPPQDNSPASSNAFAVNCLIFGSIAGSLMAAFFAILTKQWVRSIQVGLDTIVNQSLRARTRQFRLDGVRGWHFADMAAVLPVLLHASLALFAIGVVDFLWITGERVLSIIIMAVLAIGSVAYFFLSLAPLRSPRAPFWSPLTTMLDLVRTGSIRAFRRIQSSVLRRPPPYSTEAEDTRIYGAMAPVSRRVAGDSSIDVEVVMSLMSSADKDTETSILYASLRELQELSLKSEIDPNLFNQPIVFSTWSYLAKTCLWNNKPPTLIPGKEDRARFLCQVLEWLGCLTKDPSLKTRFGAILDEGKQLSRAIFNEGFKNRDIRDMVIGHLARTTINHMEQTSSHECRLCVDSSSGRSEAIDEYLLETDPQLWPQIQPMGETLTRRQREGKWIISYITAQTRCLWNFSPKEPPSKDARHRIKRFISKFGLGDPKIYDEWRARRWQAPIMRENVFYNHVSLWMEVIRKAREKSRLEIKAQGDPAIWERGAPIKYGYAADKDDRNISPPHTWSLSSSRSSSLVSSPADSRSPRPASPATSLREKPPSRSPSPTMIEAKPSRRERRSRSRSPSPGVAEERASRGRTKRPIFIQKSSDRSLTPVREESGMSRYSPTRYRSESPSRFDETQNEDSHHSANPLTGIKRTRFGSPTMDHPPRRSTYESTTSRLHSPKRRHRRRRRRTYESEMAEVDYGRQANHRIPPWKIQAVSFRPHICFIQDNEDSIGFIPDDTSIALFNIYLISDTSPLAAVVISPASGLKLGDSIQAWKQISNNDFEFVSKTIHGDDLEDSTPSVKYMLSTTQIIPEIVMENATAMPATEFISHISNVLDRLGVPLHIRRQFITANMDAFLVHSWIMYRFVPPEELARFVDLSVSLPRCSFRRYFLLFKGVSGVEARAAEADTEDMISELAGEISEANNGNELLEIGIMDCTPRIEEIPPVDSGLDYGERFPIHDTSEGASYPYYRAVGS